MGGFESINWGPYVVQTLFATLIGGTFAGAWVQSRLARKLRMELSTRQCKEQIFSDLLVPLVMHMARTEKVSERYRDETHTLPGESYIDACLMRDSNTAVRDTLLTKGHLIPKELRHHANTLVGHYDLWLGRFTSLAQQYDPQAGGVFDIGFLNERFPRDSVQAFHDSYAALLQELHGVEPG